MNEITAKFDLEKHDVLVGNNVQTIFDHLNDLEKESKIYSKRWFWELLQNAQDAVDSNQDVSVKVVLDKNQLSFFHTGNRFLKQDILHLIYHGSSKKSLENKTGRFGTGFMSTHLLSRIVNITGQLDDDTYFQFELSREGETVEEQYKNLEDSYHRFCSSNSPDNRTDGTFNTVFSYNLPEPNVKIATNGLNQLEKILPFVMAFNPKIKDIYISNNGVTTVVNRGAKETVAFKNKQLVLQTVLYNTIENRVLFVPNDTFDIGVLMEKDSEGNYSIIELDENYPKLFFDFPLFGTEKIGLPAVINSNGFDLKKERDGVYLGEDDQNKPTIIENKRIISSALAAFEILVAYSAENKYSNFFNLFKVKKSFEYSWLNVNWLNDLASGLINVLIGSPYIPNQEGLLKINEIIIPYSNIIPELDYYTLVSDFKPDYIPLFEETLEWIVITHEYSILQDKSISEYDFIVDEAKVCRLLEQAGDLFTVDSWLDKEEDVEEEYLSAKNWFNRFFKLLSKDQTEQLSSAYAFIPNQNNKLIKRAINSPYFDGLDNEEIKTVANNFNWDLKATLIFPGIVTKGDIFFKSTLDNILNKLDKICDEITDDDLSDVGKRFALIKYLDWLIINKKVDLIKDTYVIVEKGRESSTISYSKRRLFQTASDKLLAPAGIWQNMSIYNEIIPKKFVLINEYTEAFPLEHFSYLFSQDLIFISPLLNRRYPNKNELKLLVRKQDDYVKLLNEKEEIINNDIEFSDIAYLNRTDDNILAKTSDSMKSARRC